MTRAIALTISLVLLGCSRQVAPPAPSPTEPSAPAQQRHGAGEVAHPPEGRVRPAAMAGSWYPGDRTLLITESQRLLRWASSAPTVTGKPIALVVPHAGWSYSGAAAAAAFRTLRAGDFSRVVVLGPSHRGSFDGVSSADVDSYATPLGMIPVCPVASTLVDSDLVRHVPDVDASEHSIEIELPFLQQTLGSFCLIPLLVGDTTPAMQRRLAERLAPLADGDTLFVFSSDFVHYGRRFDYVPFGATLAGARPQIEALENRAIERLTAEDASGFRALVDSTHATICGRHDLGVLLELLPRIATTSTATLLAHYASVDLPGPKEESGVWYVAMAYTKAPSQGGARPLAAPGEPLVCRATSRKLSDDLGRHLVRVARAALRTKLTGTDGLASELAELPSDGEVARRQAVFVTLRENGELRGCVGQVEPTFPLPEAVVRAAIDAALEDSRFAPVVASELPRLQIEVTALTPPRPVTSWQAIELGKHGIVLAARGRRALFLPQVAVEQHWTIEQTLGSLARKAGLPTDAWRDPEARFAVFTGQHWREAEAKP